jgi:hypothetical protein
MAEEAAFLGTVARENFRLERPSAGMDIGVEGAEEAMEDSIVGLKRPLLTVEASNTRMAGNVKKNIG